MEKIIVTEKELKVLKLISTVRFGALSDKYKAIMRAIGRQNCQYGITDDKIPTFWSNCGSSASFVSETFYRVKESYNMPEGGLVVIVKGSDKEGNPDTFIESVWFNDPVTIIFWEDGTKTVVKTSENDDYDPITGFLLCYYRKKSEQSRTQVGKLADFIKKQCGNNPVAFKSYLLSFYVGDSGLGRKNIDDYLSFLREVYEQGKGEWVEYEKKGAK